MYKAVYADSLIVAGDLITFRRRSWCERLLSWPWKPWRAIAAKSLPKIA